MLESCCIETSQVMLQHKLFPIVVESLNPRLYYIGELVVVHARSTRCTASTLQTAHAHVNLHAAASNPSHACTTSSIGNPSKGECNQQQTCNSMWTNTNLYPAIQCYQNPGWVLLLSCIIPSNLKMSYPHGTWHQTFPKSGMIYIISHLSKEIASDMAPHEEREKSRASPGRSITMAHATLTSCSIASSAAGTSPRCLPS